MEKGVVWLVVGLSVVRVGNQLSCEGKNGNKSNCVEPLNGNVALKTKKCKSKHCELGQHG